MKNIVKFLVSTILMLAMVLSVASCAPGAEEFYIDGPASVTMQVGDIVVLDLVKPESLKGKVEWTVDDNSIAEVVKGTIVAKAEGITVVHATLDDYSDKIIVTVTTHKDNTGNNTGNTGNNGGSTGGNTGNNGGSTGDNTGNTGGNTGTGDNTGNNGGSTGDNTGNNGGSTGDNTGNTGGSTVAGLIGSIDFTSTTHRVSLSTSEQVWTNGNVTLTNTVGDNPVADYSNPARFYPNSSIIIDCQGMKKIVMNCDNQFKDSTGALQSAAEAAGASVVVDGETITITLSSAMNSFTMKIPSQARLKTLEVYSN